MSLTKLTLQLFNAVPQSSKAAPNKAHVDLENGILMRQMRAGQKMTLLPLLKTASYQENS